METVRSSLVAVCLLGLLVTPAALAGQAADPRPGAVPDDSVVALVAGAREAAAAGDHAAAARRYALAAGVAPEIADWLTLSHLQAAARAGDTAAVREAAGRLEPASAVDPDSVRLERARAHFVAGDRGRGLALARQLPGAADPALWTEHVAPALLAAGDTARARDGLLAAAGGRGAPSAAGELLLDLAPDPSDLLILARADRSAGRSRRARRILRSVIESGESYYRTRAARMLADLELDAGRLVRAHEVAAEGIDAAPAGPDRARLELISASSHARRGQIEQAVRHYRRGAEAAGGEQSARAAYLLADLAHDRGELEVARERYRAAAERFPATDHGGLARMRLGFLAFAGGRWSAAAGHFRAYRRGLPRGDWATASVYWEGRSRSEAGEPDAAAGLYEQVIGRDPISWYGVRAAARLGRDPLAAALGPTDAPPAGARTAGPTPSVDALVRRMGILRELAWRDRALRELDQARERSTGAWDAAAVALRLGSDGWALPAIRLGWSGFARNGGEWTRGLLEAVWPLPYRDQIERSAAELGLPPALVAGVARQESAFDPSAVSVAGAVGLMQLMPATAAELARERGEPPPGREELTDPFRNLALGTRYLAGLLDRFPDSGVGVLASYNAGPHRWRRWRRFPEASVDDELLIERIPFRETRLYVKLVLRNASLYARLHGLEAAGWDGGMPSEQLRLSAHRSVDRSRDRE